MVHSGTFVVERSREEAFDLLSTPERFAPLMPDFESMTVQNGQHFTLRIVIAVGSLQGHANLAMELSEAERPSRVRYAGEGTVAGGPLRLQLVFTMSESGGVTTVDWQGEVTLGGSLAFLAGGLLETAGRENLQGMAERIKRALDGAQRGSAEVPRASDQPGANDFDI